MPLIPKILWGLTLIFIILSAGCGFAIRYGGEQFKDAVSGHMVLGLISLVLAVATFISLFKS